MPATHFNCKKGLVPFQECINNCQERCMLPRTLRLISRQRKWDGKPSTTQLLQGTREAFLKIVTEYAINPDDRAFATHGTLTHAKLDKYTGDNELAEERLHDMISSGQFDNYYLEDNQDIKTAVLADTKTSGSFKVAKALGIGVVKKDVPVTDEEGNPVRYKTGKKKGQVKTKQETEIKDGFRKDRLDWAIQLNDYRMKIEAAGFPVNKIQIEALVRDGGTYIAKSRGIENNIYLIPINRISDHWIKKYFEMKWNALKHALETGEIPPKCSKRETWGGRKCDGYCDVADKCQAIENGAKLDDVKGINIKMKVVS